MGEFKQPETKPNTGAAGKKSSEQHQKMRVRAAGCGVNAALLRASSSAKLQSEFIPEH